LDFHHINKSEKDFRVSFAAYSEFNSSPEKIILEINKCEIFCRNCHRQEHFQTLFDRIFPIIENKLKNHKERRKELDKKEVCMLYDSGLRQIDIAKSLHCAKSTISGILKNRNLEINHEHNS
jgi:hypothetical protein